MRFTYPLLRKLMSTTIVCSFNGTARGTFLTMLMPLSRPYRSNKRKDNRAVWCYDWTWQRDTMEIDLRAVTCSITLSLGPPRSQDVEREWQSFSRFDSFRYQMQTETHINNISMVFPVSPETFIQYYGLSGVIGLFHLFNMDWLHGIGKEMCKRRTLTAADPFLSLHMVQKVRGTTVSMIEAHRSYDR
jgi:hypothetical protein